MSAEQQSLVQELGRRESAKARVLAALVQAGSAGLTNAELARPSLGGLRAVGRVNELVHAGYAIEVTRVRGGVWRYVYRGRREPEQVGLWE